MRGVIIALALLAATPAVADDLRNQFDGRHQARAFWLHNQAWPTTRTDTSSKIAAPAFTKTYVDGIASRIHVGPGGRVDLFESKLGSGSGLASPAFVGSFDHGTALLALRWHPGE
jgi:Tfp pilus assembly protein PilV